MRVEEQLMQSCLNRRSGGDWGAITIEAIIVVPVMMLLLTAIVQCALWAHAEQVVHLSASEGDRVARDLNGGLTAGQARAYSIVRGPGSDLSSSNVVVALDPGDMASVTVTGSTISILPGMAIPVSAVAIGPIQEFRASE
jgi:hypothetical protein